jgi:hypothetical protein
MGCQLVGVIRKRLTFFARQPAVLMRKAEEPFTFSHELLHFFSYVCSHRAEDRTNRFGFLQPTVKKHRHRTRGVHHDALLVAAMLREMLKRPTITARVAELADARDLKSRILPRVCRFDPGLGHHGYHSHLLNAPFLTAPRSAVFHDPSTVVITVW